MSKARRLLMWVALVLIVLLIVLSIVGAFYGAERAAAFFSSLILAVYWSALAGVLTAALVTFRRLIRLPGLLLIHLGCVFVLAGAMWGSSAGHRLQKKLFGIDKVAFGYMMIYEGSARNTIVAEDDRVLAELPFSIYLKDFRIEYYNSRAYVQVQKRSGERWKMPAKAGRELVLNEHKIKVVRVFKNFKVDISTGLKIATDSPGPPRNPAVQIEIEKPNGTRQQRYVFERFPQDTYTDNGLKFTYVAGQTAGIRDYFSDLVLLEGGKRTVEKTIEVNHPLHYGGYHFYQHAYDHKDGQYTILTVYSDSGLNLVYAGYLMLSSGVIWHFWLRHIFAHFSRPADGN